MITTEIQIHGYRKGHQLLASSTVLSKDDQAVVDRLSDVAGPLRPKEQFAPYLTTYPLPSGNYYVVARTWQDESVPRAGCVRTKSLLINTKAWSKIPPFDTILHLLSSSELPTELEAIRIESEEQPKVSLPPIPISNFNASELLEALFLEESKPIVVFDAPNPELIALHLLAALWPKNRRRFALSTFALSPRKIGGRDLDLVFSPSTAKARFSDWSGRRIDGRATQIDRHRWTKLIVRSVFEESTPRLLSDNMLTMLEDSDTDSATVLRIALLWDELFGKLDQTPTAALGLLDIANSGMLSNTKAIKLLEPRLVNATSRAGEILSHIDAWDFVGAITRKMKGHDIPDAEIAVKNLAAYLAEHSPNGVIRLIQQSDPNGAINSLIPSIAMGFGNGVWSQVKQVLINAPLDIIASIVAQGSVITSQVAGDNEFIEKIATVLSGVDQSLADKTSKALLPFLVDDRQLPAAIPIFNKLDSQGIVSQLRWLGKTNDFQAQKLSKVLIERAREVGGITDVRDILIMSDALACADVLLALTIEPVRTDVLWLLDEKQLSETRSTTQLIAVLRRADERQFAAILSDINICERVVACLPDYAVDILERAIFQIRLPLDMFITIIKLVLPKVNNARKFEVAEFVLGRCLGHRFKGDETEFLCMLLGILGAQLDGRRAVYEGLERGIDEDVASRNIIIFEKAPSEARQRIVDAVDEIARVLHGRRVISLGEVANDACAKLMFDAESTSRTALVDAAGTLITSLLSARRQPVSLIIAALFPIVYKELAKPYGVPERLNIFSFFDWDRCKIARNELVEAFMSSSWRAGDLALTACRCGDVAKILKQVAKSSGGKHYLVKIDNDLDHLDEGSKRIIKRSISEILDG